MNALQSIILAFYLYSFVEGLDSHNSILHKPFQVSIRDLSGKHVCSGAIIAPNWVVTTADCILSVKISHIITGTHSLRDGGIKYDMEANYTHDNFNQQPLEHNIGLIEVKNMEIFPNVTESIRMASFGVGGDYSMIVSGWGVGQRKGVLSDELVEVQIKTMDIQMCRNITNIELEYGAFCTYPSLDLNACAWDQGNPITSNDALFALTTLNSCSEISGYPDIGVFIVPQKAWIENVTNLEFP